MLVLLSDYGWKESMYRKKRKGKPFSGRQRHENSAPESIVESEVSDDVSTQGSVIQEELLHQSPPGSASRRKLNLTETLPQSSFEGSVADVESKDHEYGLVNMNTQAFSISAAHVCSEGESLGFLCHQYYYYIFKQLNTIFSTLYKLV